MVKRRHEGKLGPSAISKLPKTPKKHISDPRLIPRIREYLETEGKKKKYISIPAMAEYLQQRYPEYGRKKKTPFMAFVDTAYSLISDKNADDSDDSSESESDLEKEIYNLEDVRSAKKKKPQGRREETDLKKEKEEAEFSDNPEKYTTYQNTNSMNNMMSNMYKKTPVQTERQNALKFASLEQQIMDDVKKRQRDITPGRKTSFEFYLDRVGSTSTCKIAPLPSLVRIQDSEDVGSKVKTSQKGRVEPETSQTGTSQTKTGASEKKDKTSLNDQRVSSPSIGKVVVSEGEPEARPVQAPAGMTDVLEGQADGKTDKRKKIRQKKYKNEGRSRNQDDSDGEDSRKAKGPAVQKSSVTFADIGGNEKNLKEICKLLVHMRHPEVYQQLGVTPPRGFLLHGPPGCGKTLLAHAIAGELDLPFIKLAATEIVSGVSGDSEEKIRDIFQRALASAPCIVFIDEIDAITQKRETASKDMERRIVAQLLACMDDLNSGLNAHVLVIGATNRPDSLDPALRRAGRFDREICLGIPDESARLRILQVLCRSLRLTSEFDFVHLAHNTPGFVGADLMALTREAAMVAVNRVFHELQAFSSKNTETPSAGEIRGENQGHVESDQSWLPLQVTETGPATVTVQPMETATYDRKTSESVTIEAQQVTKEKADTMEVECVVATESETLVGGKDKPLDSECREEMSAEKIVSDGPGTESEGVPGTESAEVHQPENVEAPSPERATVQSVPSDTEQPTAVGGDALSKATQLGSSHAVSSVPPEQSLEAQELDTVLSWLKEHPPLEEEQLKNLFITPEDFQEALQHVQPSAKREGFATIPDVTWDDIGALHEVREELQLAILAPVRYAQEFRNLGLNRAQGVLLAGPPGCGKTLLAKAVANESGINFISVKGPELLNMYVGESERGVRQVFQRARNSAPCVIFFDELDALCPRRSDSGEGGSSVRVVNQLLTEMDGLEERKQVFIMAATNRPDIIDPAVLRPGRLDKTLYVGLPSADDRLEILKTLTKNGTKPLLDEDVSLSAVAANERCDRYTGADLAALVREASITALKEVINIRGRSLQETVYVKNSHFQLALSKVKPSVSAKDQLKYRHLQENLS